MCLNKNIKDEVTGVQFRKIKRIRQGKHPKVASMLDDESTILAVRQYISTSGQSKFLYLL